jgi:hypothetical protein
VAPEDLSAAGRKSGQARVRDIEAIDVQLRLVATLHRAARERVARYIDVADALLDERRELTRLRLP